VVAFVGRDGSIIDQLQAYWRYRGGSVNGDPQLVGLQGQQYQVHGYPDSIFNLISSPEFSLNSRFVYLSSGICNYNNTACWSHPGTYLDDLGLIVGKNKIRATAGTYSDGLRLWLNDVAIESKSAPISKESLFLTHQSHDNFYIRTPLFHIEVTNSDHFFNLRVLLLNDYLLNAGQTLLELDHATPEPDELAIYPSAPIHGLIGQTWRNIRYPENGAYEGTVDDYLILSNNIFDPVFPYSQFNQSHVTKFVD